MTSIRARLAITVAAFGGLLAAALLIAPLLGSTPISLWRAFDRAPPLRRQRGCPDLLHRPPAPRAGRRHRRRRARGRRRGLPGAVQKPAGLARHARRVGRRGARRRSWRSRSISISPSAACRRCRWPASPAHSALSASSTRWPRRAGAALSTTVLLLAGVTHDRLLFGGDHVHAVSRRLHRYVAHGSLADGDARCRRIRAAGRVACHSLLAAFVLLGHPAAGARSAQSGDRCRSRERRGRDARRADRARRRVARHRCCRVALPGPSGSSGSSSRTWSA